MLHKKKYIFIVTIIISVDFVLDFLVFIYNYHKLAFPFLQEEQRVENANYIIAYTSTMFCMTSIIIGVAIYFLLKKIDFQTVASHQRGYGANRE